MSRFYVYYAPNLDLIWVSDHRHNLVSLKRKCGFTDVFLGSFLTKQNIMDFD